MRIGFFAEPRIGPRFGTLHSSGLHIYFSPYEVAAYVYGPQSAKLRFDDCKSLMRPWFKNALGLW
jgi:hypothetical protein